MLQLWLLKEDLLCLSRDLTEIKLVYVRGRSGRGTVGRSYAKDEKEMEESFYAHTGILEKVLL